MRKSIEFFVASLNYERAFGIMIRSTCDDPRMVGVAMPLEFTDQHPDMCIPDPTIKLTRDECQQLMDELWKVGLRPSEGSGSAGSLAATERHLKDMQTIAFKMLEAPLRRE